MSEIFENTHAIWNRLETQLQRLAPDFLYYLRPGASEETLQRAEAFIPITLPEEVKAFYRIHDGQLPLVDGWSLYSVKSICESWLVEVNNTGSTAPDDHPDLADPTDAHRAASWHPHWLPFMGHWFGPRYCIDLAPGPKGRVGQIIFCNNGYTLYPGTSDHITSTRIVAPSIEDFFATLVEELEEDVYAFDEETGILWSEYMWLVLSNRESHQYDPASKTWHKSSYIDDLKRRRKRETKTLWNDPYLCRGDDWEDMEREHPRNAENEYTTSTVAEEKELTWDDINWDKIGPGHPLAWL